MESTTTMDLMITIPSNISINRRGFLPNRSQLITITLCIPLEEEELEDSRLPLKIHISIQETSSTVEPAILSPLPSIPIPLIVES
jgi:hypothetical protein